MGLGDAWMACGRVLPVCLVGCLVKTCKDCGETKPLDEFPDRKRMKDGKNTYCRPCCTARRTAWRKANPEKETEHSRRYQLKRNYGMTLEQWDEMFEAQGGCCAVCGTDEPGGKGTFHVDHCHDSGEVRALLCNGCNVALGMMDDDPERIRALADYAEAHNSKNGGFLCTSLIMSS